MCDPSGCINPSEFITVCWRLMCSAGCDLFGVICPPGIISPPGAQRPYGAQPAHSLHSSGLDQVGSQTQSVTHSSLDPYLHIQLFVWSVLSWLDWANPVLHFADFGGDCPHALFETQQNTFFLA